MVLLSRQECYKLLTSSCALQLGLGIALEYILDIGIENIWKQIQSLAGMLRDKLRALPGVTLQDKGRLLCGIVSFTLVGSPLRPPPSPSPFNMQSPCGYLWGCAGIVTQAKLHVEEIGRVLHDQHSGCGVHSTSV